MVRSASLHALDGLISTMPLRPRFTIARLFLWTLFVAVYSAIFSALPATTFSFGCASSVVVAFIFIDAFTPSQKRFHGVLGVSFFACGLAYAVTTGFLILELNPSPTPPKPPLPFWVGLYHLVTGSFIRDIAQEIGAAIAIAAHYTMTITGCTLASTAIALGTLRQRREAKWLLLLNSPGLLLAAYLLVVTLIADHRVLAPM